MHGSLGDHFRPVENVSLLVSEQKMRPIGVMRLDLTQNLVVIKSTGCLSPLNSSSHYSRWKNIIETFGVLHSHETYTVDMSIGYV